MSYLSTLVLGVGLLFSTAQGVENPDPVKVFEPSDAQIEEVQKEIIQLLRDEPIYLGRRDYLTVVVVVNDKQECRVIGINTKDRGVHEDVRKQLDGQKIKGHEKGREHTYICPMKLRVA